MSKAWLPNSLSIGNLVFGFLSILFVSEAGNPGFSYKTEEDIFFISSLLILIAALFDGLDGPMARKLNVESKIGKELDSFADLVTFGIAPAFLIYKLILSSIKINFLSNIFPLGMLIASFYPVCASYRLSRFAISNNRYYFTGLPSPISGIIIALIPILSKKYQLSPFFIISIFIILSLLMISNIRYTKPQVTLKAYFTIFRLAIFFIIALGLILKFGWYWVIFFILVLYIFLGVLVFLIEIVQKLKFRIGNIKR